MSGWSKAKRDKFEESFYSFLNSCFINSKNTGFTCLGENLYDGQRRFITAVLDGLEQDKHKFFVLKSRQLGLSTISRALSVFYIGIHRGLGGALVFDSSENRESARAELEAMIDDLPARLKFPSVKSTNRQGITLINKSRILFKSAGVKKTAQSGGLGRSVGLSMAHLSELCSYSDPEGLESFESSLSDENPDRLYIYESTARGFNLWHTIWSEARKDTAHCVCIFLGWWSHPKQRIERSHPDFELYGCTPPTPIEAKKIEQVRELYDFDVSMEALAWIRRRMNPSAQGEGDADPEFEGSNLRIQENPWTEEEAFQQTGSIFFSAEKLTEVTNNHVDLNFKSYMYSVGAEFSNTIILKAPTTKMAELKVWEEPDPDGYYVMGIDPAFGENENNDRSSIQVCRCYADGITQVAEYASPLIKTDQLAYVIASLLGWYGKGANSQIKYALELNGPGTAVFSALRSLRHQLESHSYLDNVIQEQGLRDVFRNVRTYLYSRVDSLQGGMAYHIKCLSVDTPLPTPTGWTTMGEVKVGDQLFDENGHVCNVTGTSDVKLEHKCYRLTFDDKSTIVADADHVWEVCGRRASWDKRGPRLVKTFELNLQRDCIVVSRPLKTQSTNLPIDPYILGLWLGDGYSASGRFCAHASDIAELGGYIRSAGMQLGSLGKGRTMDYQNIVGLFQCLKEAKLINNKHIPSAYLRASYEQRVALLQGLMDTDGTLNPKNGNQCSFCTTNAELAAGFTELVRTLGFKAKYHILHPKLLYKGKLVECAPAFQFFFTAYADIDIFRLKRKVKKLAPFGEVKYRRSRRHIITSLEPIESVPVRCVAVDSSSHLYLAGRGMVPTHNTTASLKVLFMERLRDFVSNGMFHIRSMDLVGEMKSIAREGDTIKAPGSMKDDRVLAAAFAIHCWENGPRKMLMATNRTRESEVARKRLTITDQVNLYQSNQLQYFFAQKRRVRMSAQAQQTRRSWRGR